MISIKILLPLRYNDGSKVEARSFEITYNEVAEKFLGYTLQERAKGVWIKDGKRFIDESNIIEIVTYDSEELRNWLKRYKKKLERRFKQKEIFITVITEIEKL